MEFEDLVLYLTSWSHVFSIAVRTRLVYCIWTTDGTREMDVYSVRCFHASGVLLSSILVTFFVVLVLNDSLLTDRINVFELRHYNHVDPTGVWRDSVPESNYDEHLDSLDIDRFYTVGTMVAYSNLRHVFPAAMNLILTYELVSSYITITEDIDIARKWILSIALFFPVAHFVTYFERGT